MSVSERRRRRRQQQNIYLFFACVCRFQKYLRCHLPDWRAKGAKNILFFSSSPFCSSVEESSSEPWQ
jgi:hypothetical protein